MTDVVRTGRDPLLVEFGRPMWAYLASEPAEALAFQQGMTDFARLFAPLPAEALDLRDARTVVDVGGGQGILLGAVLDRHPDVDGVLFENKTVLGSLRADPRPWRRARPARRCARAPRWCRSWSGVRTARPARADWPETSSTG